MPRRPLFPALILAILLGLAGNAQALRVGLDDRNAQTPGANELGSGTDFDELRALITGAGHTVVPVSSFEAVDLAAADIQALYLVSPYSSFGGTDYTSSERSAILGFLNSGGGLVLHAESGAGALTGSTQYAALAATFGISFADAGTEAGGHEVLLFNAHPVTAGLGSLPGTGFCLDFQRRITTTGPAVDLTSQGPPLVPQDDALAAYNGGAGQGNAVFVSDISAFKDVGVSFDTDIQACNNTLLAENILDFVLTENPIPEPGTFALMAIGLLGIALRRQRTLLALLGCGLVFGLAAPREARAVCLGTPTQCLLGQFGAPFAEPTLMGIETAENCLEDQEGELRCKITAGTLVVLDDDRFLYWNALEGTENVEVTIVSEFGFVTTNDQSRLLSIDTANADAPSWTQPDPVDGGANPDGNPDGIGPCEGENTGADGALFCSDQVILHDGRVLAAGGTDYYNDNCIDNEFTDPLGNVVPFPLGSTELEGLKNARIFDPADDTWTQTGSMEFGRWYPAAATLPNGNVFIASGVTRLIKPVYPEAPFNSGRNVVQTETYDTACGTWSNNGGLAERTLPLFPRIHLLPNGRIYYNAGGQAFNPFGHAYDQALWNVVGIYNPTPKEWTDHGIAGFPLQLTQAGFGALVTNLNPTNPNGPTELLNDLLGEVIADPEAFAAAFNDAALALIEQILNIDLTDPDQVIAMTGAGFRGSTFSVMLPLIPNASNQYRIAEFLTAGGTQSSIVNPSPGSYVATALSRIDKIDMTTGVTGYESRLTGSLNQPRWYGQGTLLPNGKVLATSGADRDEVQTPGSEIAVVVAELFDPVTETWSVAATQNRQRTYHNSAALMPDGRVLVGGHAPITTAYGSHMSLGPPFAPNEGRDPTFEIYSPPYVFSTLRPVIQDVLDNADFESVTDLDNGGTYTIQASNIALGNPVSIWLMRRTATTHVTDADQRAVQVRITASGGGLYQITLPNANVLPPGQYLLFVRQHTATEGVVPSKGFGVSVGSGVVGACP